MELSNKNTEMDNNLLKIDHFSSQISHQSKEIKELRQAVVKLQEHVIKQNITIRDTQAEVELEKETITDKSRLIHKLNAKLSDLKATMNKKSTLRNPQGLSICQLDGHV